MQLASLHAYVARQVVRRWIEQGINGWRLKAMLGQPPTWRLIELNAHTSVEKVCKLEIQCLRLSDATFFGIPIEHKPVTRDERNTNMEAASCSAVRTTLVGSMMPRKRNQAAFFLASTSTSTRITSLSFLIKYSTPSILTSCPTTRRTGCGRRP